MEQSVLVDSNFFISRLRKGLDPFQELAESNDEYEFYSCGVVMSEVCCGVRLPKLYQQTRENFSVMCWVPTTDRIWDRVCELSWKLARQGFAMQITDLVIAASAIDVEAQILTLDSDFSRIPGVQVIDRLD